MKAITLRNVPARVATAVRRRAREKRTSLNRTVIELLELGVAAGTTVKPGPDGLHHDLDHLAGVWSREEAEAFDRHLREQRRVDPKDWE